MARKTYKKKIKNGTEYYFVRIYDEKKKPRDIYALDIKTLERKIHAAKKENAGEQSINKEAFGIFLKSWLFDINMINKKPSTQELYESIYRNHIEGSTISKIKLRDLTNNDVQNFYNKLHTLGKSSSLIKTVNTLIAPCVRYAAQTGEITRDFSHLVIIPKDKADTDKNEGIRPFTKEEQSIFENAITNEEYGPLYMTALYTGMRQGELLALQWKDIDLIEKKINVYKTFKMVKKLNDKKQTEFVGTPKTESSTRTVPLPAVLADYLVRYKKRETETYFKYGCRLNDNYIVFHDHQGKYLCASNIRQIFKRILRNSKIEERRFHDLRHTYATRLFELGENAKTIQTILGHANVSITLDTYTHVDHSIAAAAAERLNEVYNG